MELLLDSSRGSRASRIASAGRAFRSPTGHEIADSDPPPLLLGRRRESCSSARHVMRIMHDHKRGQFESTNTVATVARAIAPAHSSPYGPSAFMTIVTLHDSFGTRHHLWSNMNSSASRRKLSTFPLDRPFARQDARTSLSEIGLRLVLDYDTASPRVIGSCAAVSGFLLMTAKHVLEDYVTMAEPEHTLHAIQIIAGSDYVVWDVIGGWAHPHADIALLHLGANPRMSNTRLTLSHRTLRIEPFHPQIGSSVAAFGYHSSKVQASRNPDGSPHLDLRDEPTVSVGRVTAVYPLGRDRSMLPFPCFEVDARFDGGMSGGPVFDETGAVCGIVCTGMAGAHQSGPPISWVATLWPMFGMTVSANRAGNFPRDINYPVVELARGGQMAVSDISALEKQLAAPNWPAESRRDTGTWK